MGDIVHCPDFTQLRGLCFLSKYGVIVLLCIVMLLTCSRATSGDESVEKKEKGRLIQMTKVQPNALGLERINREREDKKL